MQKHVNKPFGQELCDYLLNECDLKSLLEILCELPLYNKSVFNCVLKGQFWSFWIEFEL